MNADQANQNMVDRLIAEGDLWSPPLIAAFRATPRHRFLDRVFQYQARSGTWHEVITRAPTPEEVRILYADQALITRLGPSDRRRDEVPISSSSQPSLMAQMLEDLRLEPGRKVLEIGAGTGYNAALIAHVVGPERLTSIDVDRQVLAEAWDHLRKFPDRRVRLRHADGRAGYADDAPYDRIMVTAATTDIEPAWLEQLAPGGLLSVPLALAPGLAYIVRGTASDGVFDGRLLRGAYFMPLRTEGEAGDAETEDAPPRLLAGLRSMAAPWAGFFDRKRSRNNWLRFVQALAFHGYLHGLAVHHRRGPSGQIEFSVSDAEHCCWYGPEEWSVFDADSRELGWKLWRGFADAGGPWPSEYRLRAAPRRDLQPGKGGHLRQGPRCQHLWELVEPRDRPG